MAQKQDAAPSARVIKLKKWVCPPWCVVPDTTYSTMALGANYDNGPNPATCVDLEFDLDTGMVWYTLRPRAPGLPDTRGFFKTHGSGLPLLGDELERHLKSLGVQK